MLEEFALRNKNKTGPQLEIEYGNGASLFLTRVSTWLRLTYLLGNSISLSLQAISIFLAAASGHRFLTEFLEVGGLQTVQEVLLLERIGEDDRREAIILLQHISNAGRYYKEMLCSEQGLNALMLCADRFHEDSSLDCLRNLLGSVGRGNPQCVGRVQSGLVQLLSSPNFGTQRVAAQALRIMLTQNTVAGPIALANTAKHIEVSASGGVQPDEHLASSVLQMLGSTNFHVQYEAFELLRWIVQYKELEAFVVDGLISALKPVLQDIVQSESGTVDLTPVDTSSSLAAGGTNADDQTGRTTSTDQPPAPIIKQQQRPQHIRQACAAKMLGIMAGTSLPWAELIVKRRAVNGLLACLATIDYHESQKQGAATLLCLCRLFPTVATMLKRVVGPDIYMVLLEQRENMLRLFAPDLILTINRAVRDGVGDVVSISVPAPPTPISTQHDHQSSPSSPRPSSSPGLAALLSHSAGISRTSTPPSPKDLVLTPGQSKWMADADEAVRSMTTPTRTTRTPTPPSIISRSSSPSTRTRSPIRPAPAPLECIPATVPLKSDSQASPGPLSAATIPAPIPLESSAPPLA